MKALVTVPSKHGATAEIGEEIAQSLRAAGIEADVLAPEHVESLAQYGAVIVGSAVYLGRWMAPAREFVQSHAEQLRTRPVWLFGSGPIIGIEEGKEFSEGPDFADGDALKDLIGARESRLFAGKIEPEGMGLREKLILRMVKSPWGDYRPWESIRSWAASIADAINATPAPATPVAVS